jgi:hypothetical protein
MLGLGLVAFDTRQAMYVISVDVALTCRCQEKLKLKKLRLVVRRWWKRYAKFKAASRLITKWKTPTWSARSNHNCRMAECSIAVLGKAAPSCCC